MDRPSFLKKIEFSFKVSPIVAILGPRQCGKTTISKEFLSKIKDFPKENYFDLENMRDIERLKDPLLTLSRLKGLIVIDEIQKIPELFTTLRVLIDDENLQQQYLILGSASWELIRQSSETLAGRISYLELTPFTFNEAKDLKNLWLRGGYPRSFLAKGEQVSLSWRKSFIKTYLERDIPNLGIQIPPENLRRFWMMLTNVHGGIFNASEIGRSLGFTHKTIQHYADILSGTFMLRQLQPWFVNIGKRQVKSPKIYLRDSGILHALMGVESESDLLVHQKLGASWEGFAIEEVIRKLDVDRESSFFWATHQKAELDLLILKDGKKFGFEIKYSSAPKLTKSMQMAIQALELDSITVLYPGDVSYMLNEQCKVVGLEDFLSNSP